MVAYLGGKHSIAKELVKLLEKHRKPGQLYIEPFLGGANVFQHMANPRKGFDVHPDLIALWQAALDGWEPPTEVSEELYHQAKPANDNDISPELRGFIGFGCSFGGKWFGNYARNKRGDNYARAAANGLLGKVANMDGAAIHLLDYRELEPSSALIYCDPPYKGTAGYRGTPKFNHEEFWETVRRWSKSNTVFVSETQAPEDFSAIWSKEKLVTLGPDNATNKRTEKLFTLITPANDNQ